MFRCLLLAAMTGVCVSAAPNQQLRNSVNRKLSMIKRNFDNEIARLEYELDMERARTDELERALNDTSGTVGLSAPDGGLDTNTISTVHNLDRQVKAQTSRVHDLEQSVGHLQRTTSAMEAGIDECRSATNTIHANVEKLNDHSVQLNTFSENISDVIRDISLLETRLNANADVEDSAEEKMNRFARSIKLAFKSEKMKLKTLTAELKQSSVGIQEEALHEINKTLQDVREITEENRLLIDRIDEFVNVTAKEVAGVRGLAALVLLLLDLDDDSVPTAAPSASTRSPEKRSDIQQIFGPALKNAIKVGSRVVRGEDWRWDSQDGVPPGPGTVTKIGMGFQNMEVMVTWDAGLSANYRIGAHGKYDLYLLA